MLSVDGIDVFYGDLQALHGVSLGIDEGEIVSIVGSNGAGKTTTINAISGILPCASGKIEFLGKRIDGSPPHRIVEEGVIQYPVHEITIAGNLINMFAGILAVGNDIDKRGNIQTGSILINRMTIGGN